MMMMMMMDIKRLVGQQENDNEEMSDTEIEGKKDGLGYEIYWFRGEQKE